MTPQGSQNAPLPKRFASVTEANCSTIINSIAKSKIKNSEKDYTTTSTVRAREAIANILGFLTSFAS